MICTLLLLNYPSMSQLLSLSILLAHYSPIKYWIISLCNFLAKPWWHKDKQNTICSQVVHSLGAELQWNGMLTGPEPNQPECDLGSGRTSRACGFHSKLDLVLIRVLCKQKKKILAYLSTGGRDWITGMALGSLKRSKTGFRKLGAKSGPGVWWAGVVLRVTAQLFLVLGSFHFKTQIPKKVLFAGPWF